MLWRWLKYSSTLYWTACFSCCFEGCIWFTWPACVRHVFHFNKRRKNFAWMRTSQVHPVIESLLSNVYCIKQTKIVDSWMMYSVGCLEVWCFIIYCFSILHFGSSIFAWSSACITCTTFCTMCVCVCVRARVHSLVCLWVYYCVCAYA